MKKELTAAFKERGIDFQFSEKQIGKEKTIELVLECSDEVIFQCVPLDEQNNVITSPKLKPHTLTDFEGNCISQLLDFLAVMMKNYFVDDEIDYSKLNIKEQRQKEILEHLDVISLDEENEEITKDAVQKLTETTGVSMPSKTNDPIETVKQGLCGGSIHLRDETEYEMEVVGKSEGSSMTFTQEELTVQEDSPLHEALRIMADESSKVTKDKK